MSFLKKRSRQRRPWLRPADRRKILNFRLRHPSSMASLVFIKTGDWNSLGLEYPAKPKKLVFTYSLKRKILDPRLDWFELVRLACWAGGYDEGRCRIVLGAIAECPVTATCRLAMTTKLFAFKECADTDHPITLAEGTF